MTNPRETNPSYERILAAGKALFIEQGFPETSMEAIAQRANVVRATVYNNFKDKEAILAEIMRRYFDGCVEIPRSLRAEARPEQTSFELVEDMIRSAILWRIENAELRPLVDLSKHLPNSPWPSLNAAADAAMHDWILEIHRREAKRGLLRKDVDLDFATRALYLMIEAVLASFDPRSSRRRVNDAVHQLALLNWHALYCEGPDA
ncbi:MAG TPA: TetR/AcrR family transcriptional regulator [Solirubrobacteraceae bacterium]|jgi:TetR/AcrR family transcriptional regulator of autoinduction and epiphytic fitness|nr:TetR/AcrR family transcriptional regulator [Solirubrobacteraceae bacterium]